MHCGRFVTAYYRFVNQSFLVPENIISLSMDGPSVNKLFKEKFESDLEKKRSLYHVRSCPLHTLSNGFSEGLKSIDEVDLDQFAVDLHGFFKFSSKKIEEYFDVKKFTEVYGQRMLRHISTKWISPCQNYGTIYQTARILFKIFGYSKRLQ